MNTILIVDDDRTIRMLIQQLVVKQKHQAIATRDGQRALEVLEDNPHISVIITDMQMPNVNGEQLVRTLRGDERYANIPIIMVSGFVQAHQVTDLLTNGVDRFVPKPIDAKQLTGYIQDMVEITEQRAA